MKKTLNFVQGAVAPKDLVPVLTHFHFYDGKVQGFNGRLTIESPLSEGTGIDATVSAKKLLDAVERCATPPVFTVTADSLEVSAGKFKVKLALADHSAFPRTAPSAADPFELNGGLVSALRQLRPFVSEDATHPWSCGILLDGKFSYATNNVILARLPCAWSGLLVTIPIMAVDELLRIGEEPFAAATDGQTLTFFYEGDRWLSTALFSAEWPEKLAEYLASIPADLPTFDCAPLKAAVETILPFCPDDDKVIELGLKGVSTLDGSSRAEVSGAAYSEARFNAEHLLKVLTVAEKIDLSRWPEPCPFLGGNGLIGLIVGVEK